MKRRLLAVLLLLLLLCALVACDKEVPNNEHKEGDIQPQKNYGTFYTDESGRRQNDLITVEITNEGLVAPVTQLSYNLYNESECRPHRYNVFEYLEIKKDGEWVKAPCTEGFYYLTIDQDAYDPPETFIAGQMELGGERGYLALEAGEYRLIVRMEISADGEKIVSPTVEFTVTAPVE